MAGVDAQPSKETRLTADSAVKQRRPADMGGCPIRQGASESTEGCSDAPCTRLAPPVVKPEESRRHRPGPVPSRYRGRRTECATLNARAGPLEHYPGRRGSAGDAPSRTGATLDSAILTADPSHRRRKRRERAADRKLPGVAPTISRNNRSRWDSGPFCQLSAPHSVHPTGSGSSPSSED